VNVQQVHKNSWSYPDNAITVASHNDIAGIPFLHLTRTHTNTHTV